MQLLVGCGKLTMTGRNPFNKLVAIFMVAVTFVSKRD